jgi:uncharacterized protein (TIGR03790 family)
LLVLTALALGSPARVSAQTGRQVLLVINSASEDSRRIGERYAAAREVPADQVVRLDLPLTDEISSRDYQSRLERPLAGWFTKTGAQDRILYIVLTRGVPLRISGTGGLEGTVASVDSELTLLYRRLTGRPAPIAGRIENPYYLGDRPIASVQPFTHESFDIFLVSRLDGFSVEDVLGLIERGKATSAPGGTFVLDMKATLIDRGGDAWLRSAAARLRELGFGDRVKLDESADVVTNQSHVLGYYSWGSNDPAIHQRTFNLTFDPGALAGMYVSTDGRTFARPPDSWQIGTWEKRDSYYAGSPQSLAGDLIHAGVTGIAAHVAEPYLDATIRPQILFPAYVRGLNLVESFYLAMPYLSWQTVVIGDPLCAPFPRTAPAQSLLEPAIDTATDLPPFFAARRIEVIAGQTRGMKPEGLRFALQGETRLARNDLPGARQAFEAAVMAEPRLDTANRTLAELYEKDGQFEKAVDRYRRVLANSPNDVIALNNLAFCLAVRLNRPKDGLPQAQRAYTLSNGAPLIADTYGWLLHLTGDRAQALGILQFAAGGAPAVGEVRFHYAVVLSITGDRVTAQRELAKALELDPSLKTRDDVIALQRTLTSSSK